MTEKIRKVLSFPSPVPAKADYQRVKSSYSVREIKQLFGLSERTVRRWTEAGIILGTPAGESGDYTYDFQALTLFRRVREQSRALVIGDVVKVEQQVTPIDPGFDFPDTAEELAAWCGGEITWTADDLAVVRAAYD